MNPIVRIAVLVAPFCIPAFVACIEVGHEAETGCLVDQTQPGCRANGRGGAASGGSSTGGRATGGAAGSGALGGSSSTGGSTTGGSGGAAGAVPEGGEGGA
jgi:hypothetical protein